MKGENSSAVCGSGWCVVGRHQN